MKEEYVKPNIVISKCLEHGNCRFDGSQISSSFVKRIEPYVHFYPVCPEMEMGLGVPRESVRVVGDAKNRRLVTLRTGIDVTNQMNQFIESYLENIQGQKIHGFIMKSRSPSCGVKDVKLYKTFGKTPCIGKTEGFFGGKLAKEYEHIPIEDEGRLTNYSLRDHFLTNALTLARFDEIIQKNTMKQLIKFHSDNKYLLMAYHQKNQKLLGKIVANQEGKATEKVIQEYGMLLKISLLSSLRRGGNINMLLHLFGYFKKELDANEKAYFLELLDEYNGKRIPFRVPLSIIYSWVVRFQEPYLLGQTIFKPYPAAIIEVTDSGKGVD